MTRRDPPDLQQLIREYGGYDKITPEAWRAFDQAIVQWHIRRRLGLPQKWPATPSFCVNPRRRSRGRRLFL
jgi:hypothetical protein